jgi:hypothetical protein
MLQDRQGISTGFAVHRRFPNSLLLAQRKEATLLPSTCSGIVIYACVYVYVGAHIPSFHFISLRRAPFSQYNVAATSPWFNEIFTAIPPPNPSQPQLAFISRVRVFSSTAT